MQLSKEEQLNKIFIEFIEATYQKKPLPFSQMKTLRETFFAGLISGMRLCVDICSQDKNDDLIVEDLESFKKKIEEVAIKSAFAKFEIPKELVNETYEQDKEAWLKSLKISYEEVRR